MSDLRATNRLLLVIAVCLVTLVGKHLTLELLPEAKASSGDAQTLRLYGCSLPYPNASESQCSYKAVQVDGVGHLLVKAP